MNQLIEFTPSLIRGNRRELPHLSARFLSKRVALSDLGSTIRHGVSAVRPRILPPDLCPRRPVPLLASSREIRINRPLAPRSSVYCDRVDQHPREPLRSSIKDSLIGVQVVEEHPQATH